MTTINEMLQQPLGQAIGWALLQFVWQGALIVVLTGVLLAALRRSGPDVRYVVSAIALALMLTVPVVTVVQTLDAVSSVAEEQGRAGPSVPVASDTERRGAEASAIAADTPLSAAAAEGWPLPVDEWLPSLVSVWLIGVVVLTLRLFSGWMWVQRMKTHGSRPAPDALQAVA